MTMYLQDGFPGSNGAAWNSSFWTSLFAGAGSSATIQGSKGRENAGTTADPSAKKGMRYSGSTHTDYEISGTFSFTTSNSGSVEIWVRASTTAPDSTGYFLSIGSPGGSFNLFKGVNGTYTNLAANLGSLTTVINTTYGFKLYAVGTSIKAKVWNTSGSEPGSYTATVTDSSVAAAGYAYIATLNGSGSGVIADFDDVLLTDGTGNALTFTGSIQPTGVFIKPLVTKNPFVGSSQPTGAFAQLKVIVRSFAGTISTTGAFLKKPQKLLTGSSQPTGVAIKKLFRTFTGSSQPTGAFRKSSIRIFTGTISVVGNFTSTFLGRVFGRPGIARVVVNKAAEAIIRIRRT